MKNIQNNGYCLSSIGRFIKLAGIIMILLVFSIIFVPFSNAQLTANSTEVQQQVQQLLQQQKELLTQLSLREVEPQVQQQLDIVSNVTSLTPDQQKQVMQRLQQELQELQMSQQLIYQQLQMIKNLTSLTPDQQKQVMQSLQQVTSSPPITIPLPP
jgi:nucleosome binding factor SPN SPT16 subunit